MRLTKLAPLALLVSAALPDTSQAGLILIAGRFQPSYAIGYADGSAAAFGDTSGEAFGDLIYFSSSAILPLPKTLTFTTPVYGTLSDTFIALDYLDFTPAGEFYQYHNSTGYLDVNIVYPGHGISSFSFSDYATAPTPPPVCLTDCGGDPPPVIPIPEPSTWLMLLCGFAFMAFASLRLPKTRHSRISIG